MLSPREQARAEVDPVKCCGPSRAIQVKADTSRAPDGAAVTREFPGLEEAALLFRALGDETRLAILRQLRDQGEVCACDFVACCTKAQPTVSHHLKVLRDAGLVDADKRGLWVHYRLNAEKAERVRDLLP